MPVGGRLHLLLPLQDAAAQTRQISGRPRHVRRDGQGRACAEHERDRARRSPCHERGGLRRPSRMGRLHGRRQTAPPLGRHRHVCHLPEWRLHVRIHAGGIERDHRQLPAGRFLRQSLGRQRHVLLQHLPHQIPRRHRHGAAHHQRSAKSRSARPISSGMPTCAGSSSSCGTTRSRPRRKTASSAPMAG